jgi:hypothetical protein
MQIQAWLAFKSPVWRERTGVKNSAQNSDYLTIKVWFNAVIGYVHI